MNPFAEAVLRTDRLLLTPLRLTDADVMVDVLDDVRLHRFIGGGPAGRDDLRAHYGALIDGSGQPGEIWLNWIVRLRDDEAPIGTVQATVTRQGDGRPADGWDADGWDATVAWVVAVPWQGCGFAAEAARALVEWLRGQGARTIAAHIHPDHHASASVAARAGLVLTAAEVDGERVWRTPTA